MVERRSLWERNMWKLILRTDKDQHWQNENGEIAVNPSSKFQWKTIRWECIQNSCVSYFDALEISSRTTLGPWCSKNFRHKIVIWEGGQQWISFVKIHTAFDWLIYISSPRGIERLIAFCITLLNREYWDVCIFTRMRYYWDIGR